MSRTSRSAAYLSIIALSWMGGDASAQVAQPVNYSASPNRIMSPMQVSPNTSSYGLLTSLAFTGLSVSCSGASCPPPLWAAVPFSPPPAGVTQVANDGAQGLVFAGALSSLAWSSSPKDPISVTAYVADTYGNALKLNASTVRVPVNVDFQVAIWSYDSMAGAWFSAFPSQTLQTLHGVIPVTNGALRLTVGSPIRVANGTTTLTPITFIALPRSPQQVVVSGSSTYSTTLTWGT